MDDKDKMVVENYVIAGLSLDVLYRCFPAFPRDEIDKVYNKAKEGHTEADGAIISVNCS